MNPLDELQNRGHEARWLQAARPLPVDRIGTYRYDLHPLSAAAILDLAVLALDGWLVYVTQGWGEKIRVVIRPPEARG